MVRVSGMQRTDGFGGVSEVDTGVVVALVVVLVVAVAGCGKGVAGGKGALVARGRAPGRGGDLRACRLRFGWNTGFAGAIRDVEWG